jgi:NTP pyrophosphatase (non-canonical NTP hydrolase)
MSEPPEDSNGFAGTRRLRSRAGRNEFKRLQAQVNAFAEARDWRQFHSPKNLATCLSVEASELLELFMWTREGPGPHPPGAGAPDAQAVADEVADVLISLLNFCTVTGIDPLAAARAKLVRLEAKYPVTLARGSALKSPGTSPE